MTAFNVSEHRTLGVIKVGLREDLSRWGWGGGKIYQGWGEGEGRFIKVGVRGALMSPYHLVVAQFFFFVCLFVSACLILYFLAVKCCCFNKNINIFTRKGRNNRMSTGRNHNMLCTVNLIPNFDMAIWCKYSMPWDVYHFVLCVWQWQKKNKKKN